MTQDQKAKTSGSEKKAAPSAFDALRNQMGIHATIGGMIEGLLRSNNKMTAVAMLAAYGSLLPPQMQQVYAQFAGQELQRQEAVLGTYLPQAAQAPYGIMPAPQYAKAEKH